jgi:hypothetical protein
VDRHRCEGCTSELQLVPVVVRPAAEASGTHLLRPAARLGRNGVAVPPPVGCARASLLDESGPGLTRQRALVVLPRRRFRQGAAQGTHACRPTRRRSSREPQHSNAGVLTARSGRVLRHDQRALCARATKWRKATASQAPAADEGARPNQELARETPAPSRSNRWMIDRFDLKQPDTPWRLAVRKNLTILRGALYSAGFVWLCAWLAVSVRRFDARIPS